MRALSPQVMNTYRMFAHLRGLELLAHAPEFNRLSPCTHPSVPVTLITVPVTCEEKAPPVEYDATPPVEYQCLLNGVGLPMDDPVMTTFAEADGAICHHVYDRKNLEAFLSAYASADESTTDSFWYEAVDGAKAFYGPKDPVSGRLLLPTEDDGALMVAVPALRGQVDAWKLAHKRAGPTADSTARS